MFMGLRAGHLWPLVRRLEPPPAARDPYAALALVPALAAWGLRKS